MKRWKNEREAKKMMAKLSQELGIDVEKVEKKLFKFDIRLAKLSDDKQQIDIFKEWQRLFKHDELAYICMNLHIETMFLEEMFKEYTGVHPSEIKPKQ